MGRPKEFDEFEALMKAMRLFWVHGYKATSIQDLVDGMGIGRGSLYGTFGGKRSLFVRALRHYDKERANRLMDLSRTKPPRQAVLALFELIADTVLDEGSRDGCFLVNTALELSAHDTEIESLVADGFTGVETFFRTAIERGQASREISDTVEPASTALTLQTLILGMFVLARSRPDRVLLRSIVKQAGDLVPEQRPVQECAVSPTASLMRSSGRSSKEV